jgi:putative NIF3 family GTP cyclohydrolase 1 type 2
LPNGLQIEGAEQINRIAFAVSATRDSINQAVENKADALVVHHGLFWTFHGAKPLTGSFAKRVFPLVKNNINLIAYHLPLDGHPDGNAAPWGRMIGSNSLGDRKARQQASGVSTAANDAGLQQNYKPLTTTSFWRRRITRH